MEASPTRKTAMTPTTSLREAVGAGDEKAVAKLLAQGKAELDAQDSMGFSHLHCTADQDHARIVRMLLEAGAAPDLVDMSGEGLTALEHALDWLRMSARFHDLERRGPPVRRIADLLVLEPARRASLAQAALIDAATGPVASPAQKFRI